MRAAARLLILLPLLMLAACGGGGRRLHTYSDNGPGPAGDPWGPFITDASNRFSIPPRWIRAVMRQESGGHQYIDGERTTSSSGAAGLMQILPSTYRSLSKRYDLGSDPYDPHDNIMAGTALIRELYDRYGSPDFLAAYTVGTRRMDEFVNDGRDLPDSTISYVASAAPQLGNDPPMRGKLASYGAVQASGVISEAYAAPAMDGGMWAVQVGAYPGADEARTANENARRIAADALGGGRELVMVVDHGGGQLYRARIAGLSQIAASKACDRLKENGAQCWAVPPGG